jgi:DUF1680 family protein
MRLSPISQVSKTAPAAPVSRPSAPVEAPRPVKSAGVTSDPLSGLPGFLRVVFVQARITIGGLVDKIEGLFHHDAPPAPATTPAARAQATFDALDKELHVPGMPGLVADAPGNGRKIAAVWPHGQVLAGALDEAQLSCDYSRVDRLFEGLSLYQHGEGYAPDLNGGDKYYDDNAWIGLDLMQAYSQTGNQSYLARAEQLFGFLEQGKAPGGGIYWVENAKNPTRNTCANGPAMEMALRLYQATKNPRYLDFAKQTDAFLEKTLRQPNGLYADNIDGNGKVSEAIYSYNQGTPIGADVLFFRTTGDRSYLDRATQTANAALDELGQDDRLWKQSPAFNAIFFRNLMALDQVAPNPRYRQALEAYTNRLWTDARDPKTGLFTQGGVGAYGEPGNALDTGGIAQLYALLAMKPAALNDVG